MQNLIVGLTLYRDKTFKRLSHFVPAVVPCNKLSRRFLKPMGLNVCVVHVKAFSHRKAMCEKLRELLQKSSKLAVSSFKYIDDMDPGEALPEVPITLQPVAQGPGEPFNALLRPLKLAQVTNVLKHMHALQVAANAPDEDVTLVVEDDVAFRDTVVDDLATAITVFRGKGGKGGVMFLGTPPTTTTAGAQPFSQVYKLAPCCDSYLVDRTTAARLLKEMVPIRFPTNAQLSYALACAGIEANIAVPNVFVDGSKLGLYLSSVDANSKMVFNEAFVRAAQSWDSPNFDPAILESIEPKWHPELLHLRAQYEAKKGNYNEASALYEQAVSLYDAHGGIIDNSSELLRNFMRLFRHLQKLPPSCELAA